METVANSLLAPDALVWEVWKLDEEGSELAGVIRVSRIIAGEDAVGHYTFFDGGLSNKTGVLLDVIDWLFADHADVGWRALRRLTVEIPEHAYALARHAHKKLGFGGPYYYRLNENEAIFDPADGTRGSIRVEGVKRDAVLWRGERRDLLVLGLINEGVDEGEESATEIAEAA